LRRSPPEMAWSCRPTGEEYKAADGWSMLSMVYCVGREASGEGTSVLWLHAMHQGYTPLWEPERTTTAWAKQLASAGFPTPYRFVVPGLVHPSLGDDPEQQPARIHAWGWLHEETTWWEGVWDDGLVAELVKVYQKERSAGASILVGFSMGGFGALLLAADAVEKRQELFDAIMVGGAYLPGSLDEASKMEPVVQLKYWASVVAKPLASSGVPLVVCHAPADSRSSFPEICLLVREVELQGGHVKIWLVEREHAGGSGHVYSELMLTSEAGLPFWKWLCLGVQALRCQGDAGGGDDGGSRGAEATAV
jgi:hypothetical protein